MASTLPSLEAVRLAFSGAEVAGADVGSFVVF